jgi:hypothetical protein
MTVRELINKLLEEPMDNEVFIEKRESWERQPTRYSIHRAGRACRNGHRTYVAVEIGERDRE